MDCRSQARVNTPKPVWDPDLRSPMNVFDHWRECPARDSPKMASRCSGNGSSAMSSPTPLFSGTLQGEKGVQLVECSLQSWRRSLGGRAGAARGARMTLTISLPYLQGGTAELRPYTLLARTPATPGPEPAFQSRGLFAAHVVAVRWRRATPGLTASWIGTRPLPIVCISGISAWVSPKRWTAQRAWAWTGSTLSPSSGNR